jgi:TolB-like protein
MKVWWKIGSIVSLLSFSSPVFAAPGDLLWQDHFDRVGFIRDWASAVAVAGNRVFVGGVTQVPGSSFAFSVRGYDAGSGALLWGDYYDREGNGPDYVEALGATGNRVFAAGKTYTQNGDYAFSVRAYDAATGGVLWEDHFDREGQGADQADAVAVKGSRVFVAGSSGTVAGGMAFTVRAYNAKSGALLWEDHFDREGSRDDRASGIAVSGRRVFAVGWTQTSAGGYAFTIRVYHCATGALLWEDHYDRDGDGVDAATAVTVKGSRVFVAGRTSTAAGGRAFSTRAYNASTGALLWEDHYDREGNANDEATGIAVSGSRVFAVGDTLTAAGGYGFSVRAYGAADGSLLWEDHYDREGAGSDWAYRVATQRNGVFVAGGTFTVGGSDAWSVRAYDGRTGGLLWQDHFDREGGLEDWSEGIAASGNRVFVVGGSHSSAGERAMSVRAYAAK